MMDRKKAADLLDNLIGMVEDSHGADYDTALKMGIEALSAQPEIIACGQGELVQDGSRLVQDLISRQAAIDALARTAREKFNLSDEFNHYLAGVMDGETAIRQLPSAQPDLQPACNQLATDCISRQVILNWLENEWDGIVVHLFDGIRGLPPAQPERKTGKWIRETMRYKDSEQEYYYYEEHCSECGVKKKIGWAEARYCPNCGARMQGTEGD